MRKSNEIEAIPSLETARAMAPTALVCDGCGEIGPDVRAGMTQRSSGRGGPTWLAPGAACATCREDYPSLWVPEVRLTPACKFEPNGHTCRRPSTLVAVITWPGEPLGHAYYSPTCSLCALDYKPEVALVTLLPVIS